MNTNSVLAAVWENTCGGDAVALGCQLLGPNRKGQLHILYIIRIGRYLPVDAELADETACAEEALRAMETVAKRFKRHPNADLVQSRSIGAAVVQEAIRRETDTVVLATPYRERYGQFSIDQEVSWVLSHAPCRVVLSRSESTSGRDGSDSHRRHPDS